MRFDSNKIIELISLLESIRLELAALRTDKCSVDLERSIRSTDNSMAIMVDALGNHSSWTSGRNLCFKAAELDYKKSTMIDGTSEIFDNLAADEQDYAPGIDFDYRLLSFEYTRSATPEDIRAVIPKFTTSGVAGAAEVICANYAFFKLGATSKPDGVPY